MPGGAGDEWITTHGVHRIIATGARRATVGGTDAVGAVDYDIVVSFIFCFLFEIEADLLQSGATFSGSMSGQVTSYKRTFARD